MIYMSIWYALYIKNYIKKSIPKYNPINDYGFSKFVLHVYISDHDLITD